MVKQKFPKSKIIVGGSLYKVTPYTDHNGVSHCDIDEYIITSIRRKRGTQSKYGIARLGSNPDASKWVNLTLKNEYTFKGDKRLKNISRYYTLSFIYGQDLPFGYYTTKLKALNYAVVTAIENVQWHLENLTKDDPDTLCALKELRLTKGKLTRLKKSWQ